MDLISEYVRTVQKMGDMENDGLDSKKKAKQYNRSADRLREIASEINHDRSEEKPAFSHLLFHERADIRIWAAHHILEVMDYHGETRKYALKENSLVASCDESINGLGNRMWLEQWLTAHPEDQSLL